MPKGVNAPLSSSPDGFHAIELGEFRLVPDGSGRKFAPEPMVFPGSPPGLLQQRALSAAATYIAACPPRMSGSRRLLRAPCPIRARKFRRARVLPIRRWCSIAMVYSILPSIWQLYCSSTRLPGRTPVLPSSTIASFISTNDVRPVLGRRWMSPWRRRRAGG